MAARLPMARFRMSSMPDDWLMALLRASCQETVSMCHPSAGPTTRVSHNTSSAGQAGTTLGLTPGWHSKPDTSAAEVGETHRRRPARLQQRQRACTRSKTTGGQAEARGAHSLALCAARWSCPGLEDVAAVAKRAVRVAARSGSET